MSSVHGSSSSTTAAAASASSTAAAAGSASSTAAATASASHPTLTDLPDHVLAIVLRHFDRARDLLNALASHPAFAVLRRLDPAIWEPLASRVAWRIRRRQDEGWEALVSRAATAAAGPQLIAVGGSNWMADDEVLPAGVERAVELFDVASETWSAAPELSCPRDAACVASDGTTVYVVGGFDDEEEEAIDSVEALRGGDGALNRRLGGEPGEARGGVFHELPAARLVAGRCFAAAACDASGALWVAGGGDGMHRGAACLRSVVRWKEGSGAEGGRWAAAGTMRRPRCGLALASDARSSLLYLCGGYSGGSEYEATVETYDMASGGQTMLPEMAHRRSGVGAGVGPDGALYVVGGSSDGSGMLASCERFDPREGAWRALPDLLTPRGYLGASFGLNGLLYAIGGTDGNGNALATCEAYDPAAAKWRKLPPMSTARANLGLAHMEGGARPRRGGVHAGP